MEISVFWTVHGNWLFMASQSERSTESLFNKKNRFKQQLFITKVLIFSIAKYDSRLVLSLSGI
jgi:hypothetical protein